jgi:hypothetical protein
MTFLLSWTAPPEDFSSRQEVGGYGVHIDRGRACMRFHAITVGNGKCHSKIVSKRHSQAGVECGTIPELNEHHARPPAGGSVANR